MRIVLCILGLLLASWAPPIRAEFPPDIQRIQKRGELVVSIHSEDSAPFLYSESGELKGIDIEITRLAAEKLGVKVRYIRTAKSFPEILEVVSKGKADVAASALYPTLERAKSLLFTDPYTSLVPVVMINRVALARREKKKEVTDFLKNPTTTIGLYDTAAFLLTEYRKFEGKSVARYRSKDRLRFINDLKEGRIAAGYADEVELEKWKKLVPDFELFVKSMKDEDYALPVSLAVGWKDQHLNYWLNQFIRTMKTNGHLQVIIERHLKRQP